MTTHDLDVYVATCDPLPEPDPDEAPLRRALAAAGLRAAWAPWTDPEVQWERARMMIPRATWDYYRDRDAYLAWIERVAARGVRVENAPPVLAWSTDKRYLADLRAAGVPVVDTVFVDRGATTSLASICDEHGWERVVVKPRVSAASFETYAMRRNRLDEATWARVVATRDMMVQPFVEAVAAEGERSVVVIDGEITHAVRKRPRFAGDVECVDGPWEVDGDEREVVEAALDVVGAPLLYARVDLARDDARAPQVMELELVEPSLFFELGCGAVERFVAGVQARLAVA